MRPFRYLASYRMGQPSHPTHPHLLNAEEIIPGIKLGELKDRRSRFVDLLPDQCTCIIPGYGLRYMTNNIFYPFHQNTNLLYLTGFNEPDAALVLQKYRNSSSEWTMYVTPKNEHLEMWDGVRTGLELAVSHFGVDHAKSIEYLPSFIDSLGSFDLLFTDLSLSRSKNKQGYLLEATGINCTPSHATNKPNEKYNLPEILLSYHDSSLSGFLKKTRPVAPLLDQLRLVKSKDEIKVMRKSGQNSGRAFAKAMSLTKPGMSEHQLQSILNYEIMNRGSSHLAYVPVVAGGKNALTLHYIRNDQLLKNDDLVLVDCGGEYGFYASDITRTWPVNGKFSRPQKLVYEAVLRTQKHIISLCREEENVSLNDLQRETSKLLKSECEILFGRSISNIELDILYPHHVGHWIGLDLHDTSSISKNVKLRKGMALTVEPGLYIPDSLNYPAEFRGIGIRIEDDIIVGNQMSGGPLILTSEAPKEVVDIEAIMNGSIQIS